MAPRLRSAPALVVLTTLVTCVGCGTLGRLGLLPGYLEMQDKRLAAEAVEHREKYQQSRDDAAFRWLFRHRVRNGMDPGEINILVGQEARRVYDDARFKVDGEGVVRSGDEAWKWGPTAEGTTAILFFRNDHLVNFDPMDFAQ